MSGPEVFEDAIRMRYTRSTAPSMREFLTALKNDGELVGGVCETCDFVQVPPKDHCPSCGADVDTFEPVSDEGTLVSWTRVHDEPPKGPFEPPFTLGVIELDGADAGFVHAVRGDPDELDEGTRVRAVLKDEREGNIADIEGFEVIG